MPLHLLGKKSWNVYNADNIARVQRDEAAAAAEEHAAEQRMQDADAARRLAILRGETPPPLPEEEQPADPSDEKYLRRERDRDGAWVGGPRKRKRAGEDDTDFEMRVARERAEEGDRVKMELGVGGQKQRDDVDIVDSRGHIDLVGAPPKDAGEQEDKARGAADRNAVGALKGDFADEPWYADSKRRRITSTVSSTALVPFAATTTKDRDAERGMEAPTTNVWGRDDPKRRGREAARLDANDPLAAMKSGAKKVRDIAKERRRDAEERGRELEELRKEERRREKRRRARDHADESRDRGENVEESRRHSHRSERSERRHHGSERRESRHDHDHAHREDTRRHREKEHSREREKDRHHRWDRDRSRERDRSSRSHRYDRDDSHGHREKDDRRRQREA